MEKAENAVKGGCPQRDSTECKGYVGALSAVQPETGETADRRLDLLERILDRDNLTNAYKRVKANKGVPGVDGMTVEKALPWLEEHGMELTESIVQCLDTGENSYITNLAREFISRVRALLQ